MTDPATPPKGPRHESLAAQAAELLAALNPQPDQAGLEADRPQNGGTRVRVLVITLAAALAAALIYLIAAGYFHQRTTAIPPELIGVWRTTAPSHADRPFELTDSTLVLHTGGSDSTVSRISDVRSKAVGEGTEYTIEYMSDGQPFLFSFTFTAAPEPLIRFRNQPAMEWRKQP